MIFCSNPLGVANHGNGLISIVTCNNYLDAVVAGIVVGIVAKVIFI